MAFPNDLADVPGLPIFHRVIVARQREPVGYCADTRHSLGGDRTAQVDPYETLVTTRPGEPFHRKADYYVPCD